MDGKLMYTFGIIVLEVVVVWAGTLTYYNDLMTWPDAVKFCKKSGGALVKDVTTSDVPPRKEKAWVGRRIRDGYKLVVTNGCYNDPEEGFKTVRVQSFDECLKECQDYDYFGVKKLKCYCLTQTLLRRMHSASYCDFFNTKSCDWPSPPELSCGGITRMSTYRFKTQGFSLPLNYTDGNYTMLCAKWRSRDNGGSFILTGCEQALPVLCGNRSRIPNRLDWNAALRTCYDNKTDLPSCNEDSFACLENTGKDDFWAGGFGYDIVEYASDSVEGTNSSLCGTFSNPGSEVTYIPCGEKRPFICEFPPSVAVTAGLIVGLLSVTTILVMGIMCVWRVRRSKRSAALDILNFQNVENRSDINFVSNEYSTIDDLHTAELLSDTDGQVSTSYDEIGRITPGHHANNNSTSDNYDHARNVNPSTNTSQDNYDHMKISSSSDNTTSDNYDHMQITSSSDKTTSDNYDHMQIKSSSDKTTSDNYDHMQIASSSDKTTSDNYDHMQIASS